MPRAALLSLHARVDGVESSTWEDPSLAQYVNDRRIALEICLTSNVQTRVAQSYALHPFREYFDRGLNVVLNTDNRLMSGVTLTDEYMHAAQSLDFSFIQKVLAALVSVAGLPHPPFWPTLYTSPLGRPLPILRKPTSHIASGYHTLYEKRLLSKVRI